MDKLVVVCDEINDYFNILSDVLKRDWTFYPDSYNAFLELIEAEYVSLEEFKFNYKCELNRNILNQPDLKLGNSGLFISIAATRPWSPAFEKFGEDKICYELTDKLKIDIKIQRQKFLSFAHSIEIASTPSDEQSVNHFCADMPLDVAIDYFKVLTTKLNRKNEPLFTESQLNQFIDKAFKNKDKIQKLIANIGNREQKKVKEIFYTFYASPKLKAYVGIPDRDEYIRLLSDNIVGFDFDNLKNNFHK